MVLRRDRAIDGGARSVAHALGTVVGGTVQEVAHCASLGLHDAQRAEEASRRVAHVAALRHERRGEQLEKDGGELQSRLVS